MWLKESLRYVQVAKLLEIIASIRIFLLYFIIIVVIHTFNDG